MLAQNSSPRPSPASVPTPPTAAPQSRKMRRIAPLPAPMVRRMAMSRPLSFTSMVSEEMMLKAATRMMSIRIRNITFRCTCTSSKKPLLVSCQSAMRTGRSASARRISQAASPERPGSRRKTSTWLTASGIWKKSCAAASGRKTKPLSYSCIPTSNSAATR